MTSNVKIFGLVLSGGKSTRMGQDKGLITYHGVPQREYLYRLLESVCDKAFLSIRDDQENEVANFDVIVDENKFKGPYNGLFSAHKAYPDVAWLVLACDLPLMDKQAVEELIAQRDNTKMATAFADKDNPLPEPLCAIWEPMSFEASSTYLEAGNGTCPRKFLIDNDIKLVFPKRKEVLTNANSQSDYEKVLQKLAI
ncbi:molybdenum cofactor guanylyltransferase [Maribacter sp. CXY002]|uniref:molybdenum cofactor guanylyltransferase n=1 Tax=Maribacter luteocoastalis TaxID=3407671 RepID=UPI003B6749F7